MANGMVYMCGFCGEKSGEPMPEQGTNNHNRVVPICLECHESDPEGDPEYWAEDGDEFLEWPAEGEL